MKLNKLKDNSLYNNLQKNKKNLIKISVLFLALSISINAFAWLASHNKSTVEADADVLSWIVQFKDSDDDSIIHDINYVFPLKPGANFDKTIVAENSGRTDANIKVEVTSLFILGTLYNFETNPELVDVFPFNVTYDKDPIRLNSGETVNFDFKVEWPYEDETVYFKDHSIYGGFHEDFEYYNKVGNDYVLNTSVDASNYSLLKDNLYLYKDDVDTYFGEACGTYQTNNNSYCLSVNLKYIADQVEN